MLFSEAKFVGVNSTAGERPMHYAVLDGKLKIQVLGKGDLEMMLAVLAGLDHRAARAADRVCHEAVFKEHPFLGNPIDVWGFIDFRSVCADRLATMVVGEDK